MPNRLQDKIAIVTGASSGFGRRISQAFAAEGACVVCADIDPWVRDDDMVDGIDMMVDQRIIKKYGRGKSIFIKTDVRNEQEVKRMIRLTVERYGRLDIIVNGVGIAPDLVNVALQPPGLRIHEESTEQYRQIMATSVDSVVFGTKHACAQFLQQQPWPKNARGDAERGWIINIAGTGGFKALPCAPSYCTSKHAIIGLTKQVAIDYASDRIHCNAICPTLSVTAGTAEVIAALSQESCSPVLRVNHPWGYGQVDDISGAAVFLASDDARFISGHCLNVDGGIAVL